MLMRKIVKITLLLIILCLSGCTTLDHLVGSKLEENFRQEVNTPIVKTNGKDKKELEIMVKPLAEASTGGESTEERGTLEEQAKAYVEKMTLEEKIGQLFMVAFRQDEEGAPITTINEKIKEDLKNYPVGGVILFKENIVDKEQVMDLIQELQTASRIPLWIGVDEEGGIVSRVGANSKIVETPFKSAKEIGQLQDVKEAYKEAVRMGKVLRTLGFNMDFAPVADIYNNPDNAVIGPRSFGQTAEEVTGRVIEFAKGLKSEGIIPVIKHFPGHGNTLQDSHEELAYIEKTLKKLEEEEMVPFKKALEQEVEAMMIGHLVVKAVDDTYPASLSKVWGYYIKENLSTEQVLLITDALNMGALTHSWTTREIVKQSFLAGYDVLLMPSEIEEAFESLREAYREEIITEERLNQSVQKIILKKMMHNLLVVE